MGDFHIDFSSINSAKCKLMNLLKNHSLTQLINRPTRATIGSTTCIDHRNSNNIYLFSHRGVLDPGLSDHNLVVICRKRKRMSREKEPIWIRDYRHFDADLFCFEVGNINWSAVLDATDVEFLLNV